MTHKQGFLFIFLSFALWIGACASMDYFYPPKEKFDLCWYGEIHIGPPEPEWPPGEGPYHPIGKSSCDKG